MDSIVANILFDMSLLCGTFTSRCVLAKSFFIIMSDTRACAVFVRVTSVERQRVRSSFYINIFGNVIP
jgi:hypothetical protein